MPVGVEVHSGFLEAFALALAVLGAQNRTALIHKLHSEVEVGDVVHVGTALERWRAVAAPCFQGSCADNLPLCLRPLILCIHRHPPQISML